MSYEEIEFQRECEVVQIPQGTTVIIPKGTPGVITQALGDTYTLQLPTLGGLYRVSDADADAIGKQPNAKTETSQEAGDGTLSEEQVWAALKNVYDPEIPVNIVDLGLVYDMQLQPLPSGENKVEVKMTLTAPGCGMGPAIAMDAQHRIEGLPGVEEADVQVVWEPAWGPEMISAEGKQRLGIED
ncbi:MAG: putative Fe-S cluster assembly protein SufT [Desulfurellaceae bacterium]|nr:putative Fe-S cluster assembly protein SufT [Desulfurellaceae bacterium]